MKTELVTSLAVLDEYPDAEYQWRYTTSKHWYAFDIARETFDNLRHLIKVGRLRRVVEEPQLPVVEYVDMVNSDLSNQVFRVNKDHVEEWRRLGFEVVDARKVES